MRWCWSVTCSSITCLYCSSTCANRTQPCCWISQECRDWHDDGARASDEWSNDVANQALSSCNKSVSHAAWLGTVTSTSYHIMVQWQPGEANVTFLQAKAINDGLCASNEVGIGEDDALGVANGARGVLDEHWSVWLVQAGRQWR